MPVTRENQHHVNTIKIKSIGSVTPLRLAKPSENIPIVEKISSREEEVEKIHEEPAIGDSHQKVETFFEGNLEDAPSMLYNVVTFPTLEKMAVDKTEHKPNMTKPADIKPPSVDNTNKKYDAVPKRKYAEPRPSNESSVKPIVALKSLDKKIRVSSATNGVCQSERVIRNQSDIFSLKEETSISSSIFSVNGSPSRKVIRRKELTPNNVYPFAQLPKKQPPSDKLKSTRDMLRDSKDCYSDLKRPSSSARNPLTGTGVSSNDEYRFKGTKRKDGNPLLGLGYSPETRSSAHRIPPGGYSHKLW